MHSAVQFLQFTYSDPKRVESGLGGELELSLKRHIDWSELCPLFLRILPCIRVKQCMSNQEEYDYDLLDTVHVPKGTPFSHEYILLNPGRSIRAESCSSASKWRTTLWNDGQWKVRTQVLLSPTDEGPFHVLLTHNSGFHHQLHLIVNTTLDHGIALYLPREVYIDKYELRNLYLRHHLPFYITTTPFSDIESMAEEAHPQFLFLFGNASSPIDCHLPVHMRYAYPSDRIHFHQAQINPITLFTRETVLMDLIPER